ncbi:hypothetical protein [Stutzerimonas nitrititolerans]|uniref:hypothetical protein n=1 Tax=Stutzerimonas nitrititolerans TaxID=2482751 RepID=UPI0028A70AF9|nr:hypothetical protein [Stutzerimonas nitrititolerans]
MRLNLAFPFLLFLLSGSVVGVEIAAPILTEGRVLSVIPAERLLQSWVISIVALVVFAYNLGKADGIHAAKGAQP